MLCGRLRWLVRPQSAGEFSNTSYIDIGAWGQKVKSGGANRVFSTVKRHLAATGHLVFRTGAAKPQRG